jgi:urease accessory protein
MSSLAGGLLHPLTVPAHLLALVALGLCIGQQQGAAGRLMPSLAFVAGAWCGLFAIAFAVRPPAAADLLLAASVLSGGVVAAARPLPALASAPLAAVSGIALGLDSPPQTISLAAGIAMLIGTGLGACLTLAVVAVGCGCLDRDWQRIGVRILGSWTAASATLVLALRFAQGLPY